jgi:hypothetical protein
MNQCEVCEAKDTKHWRRCEEHYRCDDCGAKDGLCMYCEGVLCERCHGARVADRIRNFRGDTEGTPQIVCPYCGYTFTDSYDYSDSGPAECDDCGNTFDTCRDVDVTYTTRKADG